MAPTFHHPFAQLFRQNRIKIQGIEEYATPVYRQSRRTITFDCRPTILVSSSFLFAWLKNRLELEKIGSVNGRNEPHKLQNSWKDRKPSTPRNTNRNSVIRILLSSSYRWTSFGPLHLVGWMTTLFVSIRDAQRRWFVGRSRISKWSRQSCVHSWNFGLSGFENVSSRRVWENRGLVIMWIIKRWIYDTKLQCTANQRKRWKMNMLLEVDEDFATFYFLHDCVGSCHQKFSSPTDIRRIDELKRTNLLAHFTNSKKHDVSDQFPTSNNSKYAP